MFVLVIGGMAGVGKTKVADYLEKSAFLMGYTPKRISFASPLKDHVAKEHGYDDWRVFKYEHPDIYRKNCQEIGASKREVDPNYWINIWKEQLLEEQKKELERHDDKDFGWSETCVIVDDCRYKNELDAAKEFDALTLFIYAGKRAKDLPDIDAPWRAHESEWLSQRIEAFEDGYEELFDWCLFNNTTEENLFRKIDERLPFFVGDHVSRFGDICRCASCMAFKYDLQPEELSESFKAAIDAINADDGLLDDMKKDILSQLEEMIDNIESGEITPMDFFDKERWVDKEDDDDEETEDGTA